ncbi:MAG TPA: DUF11 domain-containing protein, partial [Thermoanaerobaculia bacterium]
DGSGWAFVEIDGIDPPSDLRFYRLDEDGDTLVGPVQLTANGDWDFDPSLAWNGGEYGLSWIRQNGTDFEVFFQRMDTAGTLLGTPTLVWDNPSNRGTFVTSTVWDGSGWAVAFYDVQTDGSEAVLLARLDPAGNLLAAPQRISDDFDPAFPPAEEVPVFDEVPQLVNKPGGGYLIFTSSFLEGSGAYEIGRLEADAAGARVGSRVTLSDDDGAHSIWNRVASDGTTYLVGYNDHRLGTQEVATVLVDAAGVVLAGPSDVTAGHDPGNSFFVQGPGAPATVPVGDGFAALWTDTSSGNPLLQAELFDGAGASVATRFPLSVRDIAAPPAVAALGDSFAVAWKDASTNDLLFDRYDATGVSLLGGEVTVTTTASHRGVGMDFSGEAFGLSWYDGNQRTFRRVAPDGTLLGSPVAVPGTGVGPAPQVRWVGSGWALVWRDNADNHLYYARLDADGDLLQGPIQVTFTSSRPNNHRLLWTGEHLGLAWQEARDPAGNQIFFTVLGLDGFKAFPEVGVADGFGNPDLYWLGDRFRVVYRSNELPGGLREVEVLPDGTLVPGSRLLANHQGPLAVAGNGITTGVLYAHAEMFFETTACLEDATAPTAPVLSTAFDGTAVELSWSAAGDPESGILSYLVYRDGSILAELPGAALSFADGGFTPGAAHTYEVGAANGAYLETLSGASGITPSFEADLAVTVSSGQDWASPGGTVTYSLMVENAGPHRMIGAIVTDALDPSSFDVAAASWTCAVDGGSSPWAACPAAGDGSELAAGVSVDLGVGDSLTFTVQAPLLPGVTGDVLNAATVATPPGCSDPDPGDDSGAATVFVTLCGGDPSPVVASQTVTGPLVVEACHTITAGPALTVGGTGELTLRAGRNVVFADGFQVAPGGLLTVEIDPSLDPD